MSDKKLARISIDVPLDIHKKLKARAALSGKTIRQILLEQIEESEKAEQKCCPCSHTMSAETIKAIEDAKNKIRLTAEENIDELLKKLRLK